MFFDTSFLKNNEIQLVLEKTENGDKEKTGFLLIIFPLTAPMELRWEYVI